MKSIHHLHTVFAWGQQPYGRAETPYSRLEKRVVTRLSSCFCRERVATCRQVLLYDVNANVNVDAHGLTSVIFARSIEAA